MGLGDVIKKTKDGCKAFLSIILYYRADGTTIVTMTDAVANFDRIYFSGNKRGYLFENFCIKMLK